MRALSDYKHNYAPFVPEENSTPHRKLFLVFGCSNCDGNRRDGGG